MREAVRGEWQSAQLVAKAQLGDIKLVHELMEFAIKETKEYLADSDPVDVSEARKVLARFFRNAVRRRRRADFRYSFLGLGTNVEAVASATYQQANSIEARLDLDEVLRDTPPEIRYALLMRYGARKSWEEVAAELMKSKDAIRVKCERELLRIRRRMGIRTRSE
jgi:DNA-directed RNA polymerase specialized sigma24 family protein